MKKKKTKKKKKKKTKKKTNKKKKAEAENGRRIPFVGPLPPSVFLPQTHTHTHTQIYNSYIHNNRLTRNLLFCVEFVG